MSKDRYESPLASRYASAFMLHLFSPDCRIQTWRRLWVALARAEHNLGCRLYTSTETRRTYMGPQELYAQKKTSLQTALSHIQSGDTIASGIYGGEPVLLFRNLHTIADRCLLYTSRCV